MKDSVLAYRHGHVGTTVGIGRITCARAIHLGFSGRVQKGHWLYGVKEKGRVVIPFHIFSLISRARLRVSFPALTRQFCIEVVVSSPDPPLMSEVPWTALFDSWSLSLVPGERACLVPFSAPHSLCHVSFRLYLVWLLIGCPLRSGPCLRGSTQDPLITLSPVLSAVAMFFSLSVVLSAGRLCCVTQSP